jgi:hypothetical protein
MSQALHDVLAETEAAQPGRSREGGSDGGVTAKFEAGQVHLAKDATWHAEFLSEMLAFAFQ